MDKGISALRLVPVDSPSLDMVEFRMVTVAVVIVAVNVVVMIALATAWP